MNSISPDAIAEPRPRDTGRRWSWVALVLALGGVAIATHLVREFLAMQSGDLVGGLFCGGGGRFDCAQVAGSDAAVLLGYPVALWGLGFYLLAAACAMLGLFGPPAERAAAAGVGLTLTLAALVFDAYLGWTMVTEIGAICLNCVATYVINLLLAIAWWRAQVAIRAPGGRRALFTAWRGRWGKVAVAVVTTGALAAALVLTGRSLAELRKDARRETLEFLAKTEGPPEIDMRRFDGLPARGPSSAPITIVVAGDFQCHYCRALAGHLERLRRELPKQVRLVFLNAPVDRKCNPKITGNYDHPDACALAEIGICAAQQGRFWEYHDLLYRSLAMPQVSQANALDLLPGIGVDLAAVARCRSTGQAGAELARQVALADSLKLYETPSIVINGTARRAGVYPQMVRDVVHAMLRRM